MVDQRELKKIFQRINAKNSQKSYPSLSVTKFNEAFRTLANFVHSSGQVCQSNDVMSDMCYLWSDQSSENFGKRSFLTFNKTRPVEDNYLKDTIYSTIPVSGNKSRLKLY